MSDAALIAEGLCKTFTLHLRGGMRLPVLREVSLAVRSGECVALTGPSGAGKSTLMRALYGNYLPGGGRILVRHRGAMLDLAAAGARAIVAEKLRAAGVAEAEALAAADRLLARLNLPERLWSLPPATFSGGEQQRVNLARGFAYPYPVMLVDEPTASLDPANAAVAVSLIEEAKARGAAIIGIFHDADVRRRVATREHEVIPLAAAA